MISEDNKKLLILDDELFCIGHLGSAKGMLGELTFYCEDNIKELVDKKVIVAKGSIYEMLTIKKVGNKISFKEIKNIDVAKQYVNSKIMIFKKDMKTLFKDKILVHELIGMKAIFDEKILGEIVSKISNKKYMIIQIEGRKIYDVPFIDEYIKSVDRDKKEITLHNFNPKLF